MIYPYLYLFFIWNKCIRIIFRIEQFPELEKIILKSIRENKKLSLVGEYNFLVLKRSLLHKLNVQRESRPKAEFRAWYFLKTTPLFSLKLHYSKGKTYLTNIGKCILLFCFIFVFVSLFYYRLFFGLFLIFSFS